MMIWRAKIVLLTNGAIPEKFSLGDTIKTIRFEDEDEIYLNFFLNVFSYDINPGKLHCTFFPLKKLARLFLLKEVKPSPDRKMMKPLSFENLFPPLRYSL